MVVNELVLLAGDDSSHIIVSDPIADNSELDSLLSTQQETDKVMILYLNQDIFANDADELTDVLKHAIDEGIETIILLRELDPEREECDFDYFFYQTPTELLEEPYNIFSRSIAAPLHGYDDYRELVLKRVLCKLVAEEVSEASIFKSLRYGMIIS